MKKEKEKEKVSGLCKNNGGIIKNCFVEGNLNSKNSAGGVVTNNMGEIIDCEFSGEIEIRRGYLGGIVGVNKSGEIINCVTKDSTLSSSNKSFASSTGVGGICGVNPEHGGIEKCKSKDSELKGGNCGGIVSTNRGIIKECKSTVELEARKHVGGIAAEIVSEFSYTFKCAFDGNIVTGKTQGGLCGLIKNEAKCFDCYSEWNSELRETGLLFGTVGITVGVNNCYYLGEEDNVTLIGADKRTEEEAGVMKVDSEEAEIKTIILS